MFSEQKINPWLPIYSIQMRRKQLTPLNHHRHRHPLLLHSNCATDRNPLSVLFFCNRIPTFSLFFYIMDKNIRREDNNWISNTWPEEGDGGMFECSLFSFYLFFLAGNGSSPQSGQKKKAQNRKSHPRKREAVSGCHRNRRIDRNRNSSRTHLRSGGYSYS